MGWGDGVKLGLAFLAVLGKEVLQLVNEPVDVAGNSLIQSQGGIELENAKTHA